MAVVWLGLGAAACRSAASYPARDGSTSVVVAPDAGFGSVNATIHTEECPEVVVTAAPAQARIGQAVQVVVRATGTDAGTSFTYRWTAAGGSVADPAAAATSYTCPGRDQAGPQALVVTVSDGTCEVTRTMSIGCFALADGGDPSGGGGAPGGVAPACAQGDATTCEGADCNQCTIESCDTLTGVNRRGGTPIAGCDIYVTDAQQQACQRAYACMRDSGCVRNSDPVRCWCGSVDPEQCETGAVPAGGPCRQAISDAAGTTDPVLIDLRLTDPSYPIGGAINLVTRRSVSCSVLSDPPYPVCRL
jgi:hypothetical protein